MQLESKRKLKLKTTLYNLSLWSFIVTVIWIGFEIYWSYSRPKTSYQITANLEPVSSNLFTPLAKKISQNRIPISDDELEKFKQSVAANPVTTIVLKSNTLPAPTPAPISTSSATP